MAGGPSKINAPNSHPSNPIHKAAISKQPKKQPPPPKILHETGTNPLAGEEEPIPKQIADKDHEISKILVGVGAVLIAGIVFVSIYSKR